MFLSRFSRISWLKKKAITAKSTKGCPQEPLTFDAAHAASKPYGSTGHRKKHYSRKMFLSRFSWLNNKFEFKIFATSLSSVLNLRITIKLNTAKHYAPLLISVIAQPFFSVFMPLVSGQAEPLNGFCVIFRIIVFHASVIHSYSTGAS